MKIDLIIKEGDTLPAVVTTLQGSDGAALNLTDAISIRWRMRRRFSNMWYLNNPGVVLDAENGVVRYNWQPGETDDPGTYLAQWVIQYPGGYELTYPNMGFYTLVIDSDMN